jgi:hypothetical protein
VAEPPVHVAGKVAEHTPPGHAQLGPLHCAPAFPAACWQVADVPLQVSTVQGLGGNSSAQDAPGLPGGVVHVPPTHWSAVHGLVSMEHVEPSGFAGVEHTPFAGLHVPAVWHWSIAGHAFGALLTHAPPEHVSVVQALLSVQVPELFAGCPHAPPLHWSKVHGLPSSAHAAPLLPAGCWHVADDPLH